MKKEKTFKPLLVIRSGISIITRAFNKNVFLDSHRYEFPFVSYPECDLKERILNEAPEQIPAFRGLIDIVQVVDPPNNFLDVNIMDIVGGDKWFTPTDGLAVIFALTSGKKKLLLRPLNKNVIFLSSSTKPSDVTDVISMHLRRYCHPPKPPLLIWYSPYLCSVKGESYVVVPHTTK